MWDLLDPNDGSVRDSMKARKLWEQILEVRYRTGEPYLNFIDTANRALPQTQKDKGLKIHGSNLCNEIHLPTSDDRTAVCCLSSVNVELFEDWKKTTMICDLVRFWTMCYSSLLTMHQMKSVVQDFLQHRKEVLDLVQWSPFFPTQKENSFDSDPLQMFGTQLYSSTFRKNRRRKFIPWFIQRRNHQTWKVLVDVMHIYLQSLRMQTVLSSVVLHHQLNH